MADEYVNSAAVSFAGGIISNVALNRVLVVGKGGYIGESFADYAAGRLHVDVVDSHEGWKRISFSGYDTVLFAAGIAHRKQTIENRQLYFDVNCNLAIAVAEKAKVNQVKQFVYLSSMAVYGDAAEKFSPKGEINRHTIPMPRHNDYYGQSKFEAEQALILRFGHEDGCFKVSIVRPPMVYGVGCPGKFSQMVKLAKFLPVVPDSKNKRSMIYIDNLCEILYMIISEKKCERGHSTVFPQNTEYVNTAQMIRLIRRVQGRRTLVLSGLSWCFRIAEMLPVMGHMIKNAFGSLYYASCISQAPKTNAVSLEDSIRESITSVPYGDVGHNKSS